MSSDAATTARGLGRDEMQANAYRRAATALFALMFFLLTGGLIALIVLQPGLWATARQGYPLYVGGALTLLGLAALTLTGLILKAEWARKLTAATAVLTLFLLLQGMSRFAAAPFAVINEQGTVAEIHFGSLLFTLLAVWSMALLYFSLGSTLANRSAESSLTVEVRPKTR